MSGPYDLDLSNKNVAAKNVDVSTLNISGTPVAGGAAAVTTLAASGAATLSSTLSVAGATTAHDVSCTTLEASGTATLSGALVVGGALSGKSGGTMALSATTFTFGSDANAVLSSAQMANSVLIVTGAVISTTRNIQIPVGVVSELTVINREAHPVQIIGATGTGITVANGKAAILLADGTNWVRITPDT